MYYILSNYFILNKTRERNETHSTTFFGFTQSPSGIPQLQ